jgi:hypothetical protein
MGREVEEYDREACRAQRWHEREQIRSTAAPAMDQHDQRLLVAVTPARQIAFFVRLRELARSSKRVRLGGRKRPPCRYREIAPQRSQLRLVPDGRGRFGQMVHPCIAFF